MNQKKDDKEISLSTTDLSERSISELAEMLSQSKDVDDALLFEGLITKKVNDSNVHEIAGLFLSKDRYCNIAALRVLSDSGRAGIAKVYRYIDQLFEHDDLTLKRLCISLIAGHRYYQLSANKRVAQFIDFPDEPIRRSIRVWLLWRTLEELEEFFATYKPFKSETEQLIDFIVLFKSKKISVDQFLERVSTVDDIAFREYTRLSKIRIRSFQALFHGG